MHRTNEAATGGTVAAGLSAPGGANNLQPHFTQFEPHCQDPDVIRLGRLAALAKECGDYTAYCWHRRALLLRQAELWQGGESRC